MKLNKTELPKGWEFKKIGDLGKIVSGGTPSTENAEFWNGDIPWLTPTEVSNLRTRFISNTKRKITKLGLKHSSAKILSAKSIIICSRASVGNICINTCEMTTNQGFKSILPSEYNSDFIFYLLSLKQNEIIKKACGSTFLEISKSDLEKIKIPVPPIGEQERIAEVLSCWDKAIEENLKIISLKEKRKKALMQSLLSGNLKFPIFALAKLGVFSKGIGISKKELSLTGVPCIRYGEIYTKHNFILKNFYSFINPLEVKKTKEIKKGDILFASSGETKEEIGKSIAYLKEEKAFAGGDIIIFSPNQKLVESIFLSYYLNTVARRYISKIGQGNSVVHIYKHNLEKIKISLPPLSEQEKIAEILSVADEGISLHKAKVELLKKQKKYLMQVLLSGKVRLASS